MALHLLIWLSSSWLILALLRQAFDLIGRLWLPVAFNLLQILCCIIGVFAACQHRRSLLAVFATTNFISFIYNLLLLFWYEGVFPTTSHYALLLSFGLPFSFSFFLKYTPGCSSHFDLKNSYWVQDDCLIPFVHLEAAQSVIHGALALTCLITTTVVLCTPKKRKRKSKSASLPTVSAESVVSGDIEKRPRSRAPTRSLPDSGSSVRSGYVNSSYDSREDVSAVRSAPNYRMPPPNNHPIQAFPNENYEDVDQEPPQRQPAASQLQYSKRKSKGQSRVVQEERDEPPMARAPPNPDANRASGIFRKRDSRGNRHSRISFCSSSTTGTIPSLHSLVSFDPKSTNYLTVQERIPTDDSETEGPSTSSGSQQSDDYEVEEVKVEAPPPPDAQYSKVKKRPKKVVQREEPPEASFETPRSARDEIPAKPRETRDRDYDQEHEDPAYERISAYRRLGQAAAERARDHRQADPKSPPADYSPADASSTDSGIHSQHRIPTEWTVDRVDEELQPTTGHYRKSWRASRTAFEPGPPAATRGLRRVNPAQILPDAPEPSVAYGELRRNSQPSSALAEVIRQSIRKSSLMSLDDSNSSASLNGASSSMASVSGISDGRKSRFQIERRNDSAIGHYHSAVEMRLVAPKNEPSPQPGIGPRQPSVHRLSQVPGLTTALGLSNLRRSEPPQTKQDYGISLAREPASPGIRLRQEPNTLQRGARIMSDESLLV